MQFGCDVIVFKSLLNGALQFLSLLGRESCHIESHSQLLVMVADGDDAVIAHQFSLFERNGAKNGGDIGHGLFAFMVVALLQILCNALYQRTWGRNR